MACCLLSTKPLSEPMLPLAFCNCNDCVLANANLEWHFKIPAVNREMQLNIGGLMASVFFEFIILKLRASLAFKLTWWRHEMETFSALLALCAGNSPVAGEFPAQRPVTRSFDVFFDLRLNKRLSKQSWGWWSGTPPQSLWRQYNGECLCNSKRCVYQDQG